MVSFELHSGDGEKPVSEDGVEAPQVVVMGGIKKETKRKCPSCDDIDLCCAATCSKIKDTVEAVCKNPCVAPIVCIICSPCIFSEMIKNWCNGERAFD